ncbi:iron export ABC transporter permease subunit FetB [candidate division KSB1 bacterium]|nr:iron export ABC transporter permease subunit FetB [candidate division KSB1 bacterium]
MNVVSLSYIDLLLASVLLFIQAGLSLWMKLGLSRRILIAGLRTTVQLLFIGVVLKTLFAHAGIGWLSLMAFVMLCAAGREILQRQKRRFAGIWGFGLGTLAMFISSFTITIVALLAIIQNRPWYTPQYAIPILGMMLGNTMNGISIGMDRLTSMAWQQRAVIENRLVLGHSWQEAISDIRRESITSGMIPIINAMSIAGLVSLPGMMTGQILAGNLPFEAAKYQILIMFMISGGTGLGTISAVWLGSRRLFDERQRLRLDRLKSREST